MERCDINQVLQEYREYLEYGGFVAAKRIPYYVRYIERFLKAPTAQFRFSDDDQRLCFLNELGRDGRLEDWQLEQADDAVQLYQRVFLGRDSAKSTEVSAGEATVCDLSAELTQALAQLREVIRIRHQPYSTEKTYTRCVAAYFRYAAERGVDPRDPQSVREYLTRSGYRTGCAHSCRRSGICMRRILQRVPARSICRTRWRASTRLRRVSSAGNTCFPRAISPGIRVVGRSGAITSARRSSSLRCTRQCNVQES